MPRSPGFAPRVYHPTSLLEPLGTSISPRLLMPTPMIRELMPTPGMVSRAGVNDPVFFGRGAGSAGTGDEKVEVAVLSMPTGAAGAGAAASVAASASECRNPGRKVSA